MHQFYQKVLNYKTQLARTITGTGESASATKKFVRDAKMSKADVLRKKNE